MPQEVVPGLFIGGMGDAQRWPGPRLCVLEGPPQYDDRDGDQWFPVLDRDGKAHDEDLRRLHRLIDDALAKARRPGLLVHCGAGLERSPLAVATWMVSCGYARQRARRILSFTDLFRTPSDHPGPFRHGCGTRRQRVRRNG